MILRNRLRAQRRSMHLALTASGTIVVAGCAGVAKWPHAWPWLVCATAVVAVVSPYVIMMLDGAHDRRIATSKLARQVLQGTAKGILPLARESDALTTRVNQSILPIPYISRDAEEVIKGHLYSDSPVLLVGSSMVGKTRIATVIIKEVFGDRGLVVPDSMTALAALDSADVNLQGTIIFLDDIERLIGSGGITDGALRDLASRNAIVATIRTAEYARFQPRMASAHQNGMC